VSRYQEIFDEMKRRQRAKCRVGQGEPDCTGADCTAFCVVNRPDLFGSERELRSYYPPSLYTQVAADLGFGVEELA
jgi:hypothetical protein